MFRKSMQLATALGVAALGTCMTPATASKPAATASAHMPAKTLNPLGPKVTSIDKLKVYPLAWNPSREIYGDVHHPPHHPGPLPPSGPGPTGPGGTAGAKPPATGSTPMPSGGTYPPGDKGPVVVVAPSSPVVSATSVDAQPTAVVAPRFVATRSAAISGVATTAPCNCLTKQYLADGSVVFQDLCTKEVAIVTPATQVQNGAPAAQ